MIRCWARWIVSDLLRRHHQAEIDAAVAKYPPGRQAAAAIELLYCAQAAYGHLTDEAVAEVAQVLGMEPTHVEALVGFYTLFLDRPHGRCVVHYCNDMPCALRGAEELLPDLVTRLGCAPGETSPDGMFSLETVMCLAACDHAPMMQVNLEYFEDLTVEKLDQIVADLRVRAAGAPLKPPFGVGPPSQAAADPVAVQTVAKRGRARRQSAVRET